MADRFKAIDLILLISHDGSRQGYGGEWPTPARPVSISKDAIAAVRLSSVGITLTYEQDPIDTAVAAAGGARVPWLNSSNQASWALVIMSWWHATSYDMIIFLSGFMAIARDYYEAASLNGARRRS